MRYHQLKDIYQHVVEINQELNDLYAHFLENTKDERTRIFLHYIIEKQAENILDIQKLISDEAIGVLVRGLMKILNIRSQKALSVLKKIRLLTLLLYSM